MAAELPQRGHLRLVSSRPATRTAGRGTPAALRSVADGVTRSPHPSFPNFAPSPPPDLSGLEAARAHALIYLAPASWSAAARSLGTDFAASAFTDAERLVHDHPELLPQARLSTWPAAIVWRIAEDGHMLGGFTLTARDLADELCTTTRTMRAKSRLLRAALGPSRQPTRIQSDDA